MITYCFIVVDKFDMVVDKVKVWWCWFQFLRLRTVALDHLELGVQFGGGAARPRKQFVGLARAQRSVLHHFADCISLQQS